MWLRYLKLIAYNHRWSSKINFAYTLHWLQKRAAIILHLKQHTFKFLNFYQIYWYWFLTHVQKYLVLRRSEKLLLDLYYIEEGISFDFFSLKCWKVKLLWLLFQWVESQVKWPKWNRVNFSPVVNSGFNSIIYIPNSQLMTQVIQILW